MAETSDFDWTQADWNDLYPRLLLVAEGKLNRLIWRGTRFGPIPGGKHPTISFKQLSKKRKGGFVRGILIRFFNIWQALYLVTSIT